MHDRRSMHAPCIDA